MTTVLVTGSGGLIGSETVRRFAGMGYDVIGIDNDMRRVFFGAEASTAWMTAQLTSQISNFRHYDIDIRDAAGVGQIIQQISDLAVIVHTAAQPSHDWAARDPSTDFSVNAVGTLNLLEACRTHHPGATFIFTSTNKVYGDTPNALPLEVKETRLELRQDHEFYEGISTEMSIDHSTHSLFGVSKVAADLLVQEYGRYFGMNTACFRGGCLTGPGHAGTELHGFLSFLMRCVVTARPYTIYGHDAKQVRDNIHSKDLVSAFTAFVAAPKPAAVYNIGGGRRSNCSMLEAISMCQELAQRRLEWTYEPTMRVGDHAWWISDTSTFESDYPEWKITADVPEILEEILEINGARWST